MWIAYYVALVIALKTLRKNWNIDAWDEGMSSQEQLNEMEEFANWYSGWLYGAILVNAIVVLRLVRYMRIHAGALLSDCLDFQGMTHVSVSRLRHQ